MGGAEPCLHMIAGAGIMRTFAIAAVLAGVCVVPLTMADRASAGVTISINKASQTMSVLVDGVEEYSWKVSTGTGGGPRAGTYKPQRLEKKWFSRKYGMSPMPSSIFFHEGFAIHGTAYVSRLGHRASHGCVRLHPQNAATLFDLVKGQGMDATTIVISNTEHVEAKPIPLPTIEMPAPAPVRETTAKSSAGEAVTAATQPVKAE